MQLLPRGLGGGGGEKTAPPPDTEQAPPPPLLPKPPTRTKPAVLPKPQVRKQAMHLTLCLEDCQHSACPGSVQAYHISVFVCSWAGPVLCVRS